MLLLERTFFLKALETAVLSNPVTALIGPRQSGKTTLARIFESSWQGKGEVYHFDLEYPPDLARLENPQQALERLNGLVIIDEIQRRPNLFPFLRVLADRQPLPSRFLVLGSASGHLLKQSSESLAGRISFIELPGFGIDEVPNDQIEQLWLRGGFPRSFLAEDNSSSYNWREQFIQTFLERDIPNTGSRISPVQLQRFWQMAAHYHAQVWNHSEIARSLGQSDKTMRTYLDLLTETFMVRQLPPWFENVGKRIVKSPKFYLRDSGLLHTLLGISKREEIERHPKLGASWEGFALEQVIRLSQQGRKAFFWATHSGAELDLLLSIKGCRWGFEFKYTDAPRLTRSLHIAFENLKLDRLVVVYPGKRTYSLDTKIDVYPLGKVPTLF